jgi:hypothetical protein
MERGISRVHIMSHSPVAGVKPQELMVHLRHYNMSMRRDGACGLLEIARGHPLFFSTRLGPFFDSAGLLLSDLEKVAAELCAAMSCDSPVKSCPRMYA